MHVRFGSLERVTALIVMGAATLAAQGTQTASITGSVAGSNGAGIPGVTIRLASSSLQGTRTLVSDEKGRFTTRLLPPGLYTLTLSKAGMQTITSTERLGMDQNYQPRFTMVSTAGAMVEVVASAAAVDKTDVKTASNYSLDSVDQLPMNRTQEAVALMTPGVVSGVGGRVQIRGAMTSGNLNLVDGQNVSDNVYGSRGSRLIDDAIEETQVITGAISAEYGSVDGGVVNSITRSGGNTFSGGYRWELANPQWNAAAPTQDRSSIVNKLGETKTFTLGGFILKDRLWFYTSYFRTSVNTPSNITSGSIAPYSGANYNYNKEEIRRQLKLTYLINENHSLVYTFMNSQNGEQNRDYSAGDLAALIPQSYTDELYNVALRSVWSAKVTSDIRYGQKKQTYGAGPNVDPTDITNSPVYSYSKGLFYQHGIFNANDGGDKRDNKTFAAKVSLFWDAAGSHQTDTGIDYYKGTRSARNEQTATGYIFGVRGMKVDPVSGAITATPRDIWTFTSGPGSATSETKSAYVNDKWSFNQHTTFQIGLRFDRYTAKDDLGNSTVGANGFSPRVGVKYDILGNSEWILGASWARYNSAVAENITSQVTKQGNPAEVDFAWSGAAGVQPLSAIFNKANYDIVPANISAYSNPSLNVRLSNDLKAPHVDEIQLSAAYSFKTQTIGEGYLKLTYVNKEWKDLLDYSQGADGMVEDTQWAQSFYTKVWKNSKLAQRKYHGIELEGNLKTAKWLFTGNVTWASLKGNYEGEGDSTPARGEGLESWTTTLVPATATSPAQTVSYDRNITAPYGALTGHVPLRIRATASRVIESSYGKTTIGLLYSFDSGSHYSDTRSIDPSFINPGFATLPVGTSWTQYRDNQRGQYVLPGAAYLDLALTHDWPVTKVLGTTVWAFGKVTMRNMFNHQQIIGWTSTSADATASANEPWVRNSDYGTSPAMSNYGDPRTIKVSAGIRF